MRGSGLAGEPAMYSRAYGTEWAEIANRAVRHRGFGSTGEVVYIVTLQRLHQQLQSPGASGICRSGENRPRRLALLLPGVESICANHHQPVRAVSINSSN